MEPFSFRALDTLLLLPPFLPLSAPEPISVCVSKFSSVRGTCLSDTGGTRVLGRFVRRAFSAGTVGCSSGSCSRFRCLMPGCSSYPLEGSCGRSREDGVLGNVLFRNL